LPDLLAADGVSGGVVGIGFFELLGDTWDPQRVQGLVEGLKISADMITAASGTDFMMTICPITSLCLARSQADKRFHTMQLAPLTGNGAC
jgi:hypothetical protein